MRQTTPKLFKAAALCAAITLGASPASSAADAELSGVVTDAATGLPLEGALVTLTPDASGAILETSSDLFGRYGFSAVPPGGYTHGATLPGYLPHSETESFVADELASVDIPLVKAGGAGDRIKLEFKVQDTKSNRALEGVPIRVQRFANDSATSPLDSFVKVTGDGGKLTLFSQPTGWYEFRYNFRADGSALKWYNAYDPLRRDELGIDHVAIAKLLPKAQAVTVKVTGLDPNDLDAGAVPLKGVTVELYGVEPGFTVPPGFDPMTGDLRKETPKILQLLSGVTDADGEYTFVGLPPNDYICTAKKPGYIRTQEIISMAMDGTLPSPHPQTLLLDFSTSVSVIAENFEYDNVLLGELGVTLEGMEGTLTEGFTRVETLMPMPTPEGDVYVADFIGVLPGRYTVRVREHKASPVAPALEDAMVPVIIDWRGETTVSVGQGVPNAVVLPVAPVPARIRGRFFVAEERSAVQPANLGDLPHPLDRWLGPAYDIVPEAHIEFSQSALAPLLEVPPGAGGIGFVTATDEFGSFEITVPPGFFGVICPLLDGYFGSNFRSKNATTGEEFAFGWPYAHDAAIPAHPFGSRGIPVSSGDVLDIDLFVRKQSYFLDGGVTGDLDCPLLDLIVAADHASGTFLGVEYSHLARDGKAKLDLGADGGPETSFDFKPITTVSAGVTVETPSARFLVGPVPPGAHKVTAETPQYAQTAGVFEIVTLPDWGFPGSDEAGDGGDVIPMEDNWAQVGATPDPFVADYKGDHHLHIEFVGNDGGEIEVVRGTASNPTFASHTSSFTGGSLFRVGTTPVFEMADGAWEIWIFEGGEWYHDTFSIPAASPPTTITLRFLLKDEWAGTSRALEAMGKILAPPSPAYDLKFKAVVDGDPTTAVSGLVAGFAAPPGGGAITLTSTADLGVPAKKASWEGGFTPSIAGGQTLLTKWMLVGTDREVNTGTVPPTITITARLKRASMVSGAVLAKVEYKFDNEGTIEHRSSTDPFPGATVRILDRHGNGPIRVLTTDGDGLFTTAADPIDATGVIYVDIAMPGYHPFRKRFDANSGDPGGVPIDFNLTMPPIELLMIPQPDVYSDEVVLDRTGPVLRGVRLGGVGDALDLTYTLKADSAEKWSRKKVSFDTAAGGAGAEPVVEVFDPVTRLWLIDAKFFPGLRSETSAVPFDLPKELRPKSFIDPENEALGYKDPEPDPLYNHNMHTAMSSLGPPAFPGQLIRSVDKPALSDVTIDGKPRKRALATGLLNIPDIPPGPFTPFVVAKTAHGSFRHFKVVPEGTSSGPAPVLYGMQANPKWLATMADMFATMNHVDLGDSTLGSLEEILPEGLFRFNGGIDGSITKNALEDPTRAEHTLLYDYGLDAEFQLGGQVELVEGWLSLATPFLLRTAGEIGVEIDGKNTSGLAYTDAPTVRAPAIRIFGSGEIVQTTETVLDKIAPWLPGIFKKVAKQISPVRGGSTIAMKAGVESTSKLNVPRRAGDALNPLQKHMKAYFDGFVRVKVGADILSAVNVLPYVGQAVYAALKAADVGLWLDHDSAFGGAVLLDLTTRYRQAIDETFDPGGNPRRVHALGEEVVGYSSTINEARNKLYAGWRGSFGAEALYGAVADRWVVEVTGDPPPPESGIADKLKAALEIEINTSGKGPWIKSVKGRTVVRKEIEVGIPLVTSLKLNLAEAEFPINLRPNTEPVFELVPIGGSYEVTSPATAPETAWCGEHPQLVSGYYPLSRYAASGGALAFSGVDASGDMVLQVSLASGATSWGAPVTVASAAGVVGVAIHSLDGGGWMAAWSEVASGGTAGSPPPSTVKAATSADGLTWTAPVTVGSLPATAFDLRLAPMPTGDLALFWLETERALDPSKVDIEAAYWEKSTTSWGAATSLFDDVVISAWDAAGPGFTGGDAAQIVAFTDVGGLVAASWDGTSLGATTVIDGAASGFVVAVTSGPADTFTAVYPLSGGGVAAARKAGAGAWAMLPPLPGFDGITATGLDIAAVDDGFAPHYLVGYAEAGTESELGFAYLDAAGALVAGPLSLQSDFGDYRSVGVLPDPGAHGGRVFGIFRNGDGVSELRSFATTESGGVTALDLDADTLDDLAELRIVDADPEDLIEKISDVFAGDDFDLDGFTNGAEIAAGTDPVDPLSHPGQVVTVASAGADPMEFTGVPGSFVLSRSGDLTSELDVTYTLGGTATSGIDYPVPSGDGVATFEADRSSVVVRFIPIADDIAEGDETVVLTITPDAAYTIGASPRASVTIKDMPFDAWRFTRFTTSELGEAGISGVSADVEGDSLNTLLEYAFDSLPKVSSLEDAPIIGAVEHETTGAEHLAIVYLRVKDALDLEYRIEFSNALGTWREALASETEEISVIDNGDGTETVTVRLTAPLSETARSFVRVTVVQVSG